MADTYVVIGPTLGGGGGGTAPTDTGFPHVTAGVYDAASVAINLAGGATYVTGTLPLANVGAPTSTGLAKVTAGAWDAAGATLVNADVNAAAAIAGSKISPDFAAQDIITTGVIKLGTTPATVGEIRLAKNLNPVMAFMNNAGTDYLAGIALSSGDNMFIGEDTSGAKQVNQTIIAGVNGVQLVGGSQSVLAVTSSTCNISKVLSTASAISVGIGTGTSTSLGSGTGVLQLSNAAAAPTGNTSSGVLMYAASGGGLARSQNGVLVTTCPAGAGTVGTQRRVREAFEGVVQTTDATATTIITYPTVTDKAATITVEYCARKTSNGDTVGGEIAFVVKNVGGTVTVVGTALALSQAADAALTTCTITCVASGTSALIKVTGVAATTIDWEAIAFTVA